MKLVFAPSNPAGIVLAVVSSVLLCVAGCSDTAETPAKPPAAGATRTAKPAPPASPDELPTMARTPEFTLTSQTGEAFGAAQLRGKVWVANFIFTRCQSTCPVQTTQMSRLHDKLEGHESWDEIRLVSFSVDPEYDTPEILREYAQRAKADDARWKFLTGTRDEIWNLSKEGFKLDVGEAPDDAAMPLFHSPNVALVDRSGRIRGYYDGMSPAAMDDLAHAIDLLLSEPAPPPAESTHLDSSIDTPPGGDPVPLPFPEDVLDPPWMEARKQAQLATVDQFKVFHQFKFTDRLEQSGITFQNRIVDDVGRVYKAVHYDHGNGLAVADVDGDGLYDIYFTTQVGSNQLWRNLGGGKFENITESAGVAVKDPVGVTASFADVDNDGDPDLFVTTVRGGNFLFENDGKGKFADISKQSGLDYVGHSSGAVFFDYNRDGLLDLFLCNVGVYTTDDRVQVVNDSTTADNEPGDYYYYVGVTDGFAGHLKFQRLESSILYKNAGNNRFVDVTEQTRLIDMSWTGDASPIDVNGDGWLDLYLLNMQGHDEYYENVNGEHFVKKSREVFPKTPWGSMGIKVFDYDNDGLMDIYISDMHSDMSEDVGVEREELKSRMQWPESFIRSDGSNIFGNAFFKNQGGGTFKEISDTIGAENYWPWGLSVGDLNADGFDDVFLASSMNYPFRYGVNSLLLNNAGETFLDSEFILGVEPRRGGLTAKPVFELDCSGADRDNRHCQGRSGRIIVWGALGSRSSAIFDLDNDGDLDIVTNECNGEPMLLLSDLSSKKQGLSFLKVRLIGSTSNRDGLGAVVKLKVGPQTYTKVHDGKSGYLSQSSLPLYFGLGDATGVDSIEVVWPSGKKQSVGSPIAVNSLIEIREPS